jgi:hypothetical protein
VSDEAIFQKNLSAAREGCLVLPAQARALNESRLVGFRRSKAGATIPYLRDGEKERLLHSLYAPEQEAARLVAQSQARGFVVCLGLGAGYHIREALKQADVSSIFVIDFSFEIFQCLLTQVDYSDILSDPRVRVLIDPSAATLAAAFLSAYLPALSGDLSTLTLRPRVEGAEPSFSTALATIQGQIPRLSSDFTVQAKFGKRWFSNILKNIVSPYPAPGDFSPVGEALVCAAGPSLESFSEEIAERQSRGACLIAVDSCLSRFGQQGLCPDYVVSIDCQAYACLHFIGAGPSRTRLVLDLASPRAIAAFAAYPCFFNSGHPFSEYLAKTWRDLPSLDVSGGNVTHTALHLAAALGARRVFLYGADFSYPHGKSYARGTYLYPYFAQGEKRLNSLESAFSDFLFRSRQLQREKLDAGFRYLTPQMNQYRASLESLAALLPCELIPRQGEGQKIGISADQKKAVPIDQFKAAGSTRMPIGACLALYARELRALKISDAASLLTLAGRERLVGRTILPVAASFSGAEGKTTPATILLKSREWILSQLESYRRLTS